MEADAWAWAHFCRPPLKLMGGNFQTKGYEYLIEPLQVEAPTMSYKKGTQTGWTGLEIIKDLHKMKRGIYKQGILVLFPTQGDVTDFSNSRFRPMIRDNPLTVGKFVNDTDQANLKRIGDAFLYFRGARMNTKTEGGGRDAHQIKGIPADKVVYDEFDEMPEGIEDYGESRMANSLFKHQVFLANPTLPGWGIDAKYELSDQRVWMIKCQKCNRYTCLELEFPSCLHRLTTGKVIRLCTKCRDREIYPRDGLWVPRFPKRSAEHIGYHTSHLMSIRSDMTKLLDDWENPKTDKGRFKNLRLGLAHVDASNQLTYSQVISKCCTEPMAASSTQRCAMGVDVNKTLNVVIGYPPHQNTAKILFIGEVNEFKDVMDLARKFNVQAAVFDLYPETRAVRDFRSAASFAVYGCDYSEHQKGSYAWNDTDGVVTVNRTEICDDTHNLVANHKALELPRVDDTVKEFARQVASIAKKSETNEDTGKKVYRYIHLVGHGPDHYRHTLNYFRLALIKLANLGFGMSVDTTPQAAGPDIDKNFYYG